MDIAELITPDSVIANLRVASKKQALQELARRAAHIVDLHERRIFEVLMERERLGSTGLGAGIAIPHGKLPELRRLHGFFARLERPIDFAAVDDRPVDLIFALLAPENAGADRSEEHTAVLQSRLHLVCRLLLEKKKKKNYNNFNYQKKKRKYNNFN